MKRKILARTIACGMAASFLASGAFAKQDGGAGGNGAGASGIGNSSVSPGLNGSQPPAPPSTAKLSPTSSPRSMRSERLSQLMGSTVKDQQGNTLGQINDFVVSPGSGRIQFAVISLNDQAGKLTAIPWQLVRPGSDPTSCTLAVTKDKLDNAQTFDASSWPDFNQSQATQQIYSHYGVQPAHMGGTGDNGENESGTGGYHQHQYNQNNPDNSGGTGTSGTSGTGTGSSPKNQ